MSHSKICSLITDHYNVVPSAQHYLNRSLSTGSFLKIALLNMDERIFQFDLLPTELQTMICEELILTDVQKACEMRLVSKHMKELIEDKICLLKPHAFTHNQDRHRVLRIAEGRFLRARLANPRGYGQQVPFDIEYMTDLVYRQGHLEDAGHPMTRSEISRRIQANTLRVLGAEIVTDLRKQHDHGVHTETQEARTNELFTNMKLLAAIPAMDYILVQSLTIDLLNSFNHPIYGSTLEVAIKLKDQRMVEVVLGLLYGKSLHLPEHADRCFDFLLYSDSAFNLKRAYCAAFATMHSPIIHLVLRFKQFHAENLSLYNW